MANSSSSPWSLTGINVFPVKGEAGRALRQAVLTDSGLVGDRAKKRPLLVATAGQAERDDLRANLVVSMPDEELESLSGQEIQIGDVVVRLGQRPSLCEGLYAETVQGGDVIVGDRVHIVRCVGAF